MAFRLRPLASAVFQALEVQLQGFPMLLAPCPLQAMSRAQVLAFFDKDKALTALAQMPACDTKSKGRGVTSRSRCVTSTHVHRMPSAGACRLPSRGD
jgi:hypothetical protein